MIEQNPPSALAAKLPEYDECADAVRAKTATLLQLFISEYEPWDNDEEWREMLTKTINETLTTARAEWASAEAERIAVAQREGCKSGLREGLEISWQHASKMRNASKLVGPYSTNHAKNKIWALALYHEGKELMEKLRHIRAAIITNSQDPT